MNDDGDAQLISETQRLAAQLFSGANAFAVAPVIAAALSAARAAQEGVAGSKGTSTQDVVEAVQQQRQRQQGQELLVTDASF